MFDWLRELYEIRAEHLDRIRHCRSCERLETEVARLHQENVFLIQRLLPPITSSAAIENSKPVAISRHVPFRVTQQSLEKKDRELAIQQREENRTLKEFQQREAALKAKASEEPVKVVSDPQIEELEKALGLDEKTPSGSYPAG